MKEIYKVQTPKRIVFGDPLYFEEFSGARLEQLVVDVQPPEAFGARVVLREFSAAEAPDTLIRTMEVYLAPEPDTIFRWMIERISCTRGEMATGAVTKSCPGIQGMGEW